MKLPLLMSSSQFEVTAVAILPPMPKPTVPTSTTATGPSDSEGFLHEIYTQEGGTEELHHQLRG